MTCATEVVFATLPVADFTPRTPAALQLIHRWLSENALPRRRASGLLFVAQGTADDTVEPAWNEAAVACLLGDVVPAPDSCPEG